MKKYIEQYAVATSVYASVFALFDTKSEALEYAEKINKRNKCKVVIYRGIIDTENRRVLEEEKVVY